MKIQAARLAKDIRDQAVRDAKKEAKEIVIGAIQRSAAEHTIESSVSVVPLPNDEMKSSSTIHRKR